MENIGHVFYPRQVNDAIPRSFILVPEFKDAGTYRRQRPIITGPLTLLKLPQLNDRQSYAMEMAPSGKQDKVVPESLRIMLRLYLRRPESKSLTPDGSPCVADTQGLLKRASIVAGEIVPVGKETDRRWEEGEDIEMLDFKLLEYRTSSGMVVADQALRDEMRRRGLRALYKLTPLTA